MKTESATYYIAVDLGATSGRLILALFDGEKISTEELHRFKHPMLPIADPPVLEFARTLPRNSHRPENGS